MAQENSVQLTGVCGSCSENIEPAYQFCPRCGKPLTDEDYARLRPLFTDKAQFHIPLWHIFLFSFLSAGLYFYYWMFLTWKQYGSHIRAHVHPIWHALAQIVPIYSLFRLNAHTRAYRNLATTVGLTPTINLTGILIIAVAVWTLTVYSLVASLSDLKLEDFTVKVADSDAPTLSTATNSLAQELFFTAAFTTIMLHVQRSANQYWAHVGKERIKVARIGPWGVVIVLFGAATWWFTIDTLLTAIR